MNGEVKFLRNSKYIYFLGGGGWGSGPGAWGSG